MPRKPSTEAQLKRHQERQRKYREGLRKAGKREADVVDAAIAAALCAIAAGQLNAEVKDPVLKKHLSAILSRARRELIQRGCEWDAATALLHRRLHRVTA